LRNDSAHHLYNVTVKCQNFEDNTSASVKAAEHMAPSDIVEVGWLEFETWAPEDGETVEVSCDNFFVPKVSIIRM